MSIDTLTLSAIRAEVEPLVVGAQIQKVTFPDDLSVSLTAYRSGVGRRTLLLSAHPEDGRVQLVPEAPATSGQVTPFRLLARKHLRDARIVAVRQPRLERVLELEVEQRNNVGQHYRVLLIVEAMGRRGNLVLVDADGSILDAARRSPPSRNPRRPVLPHLRYAAPPPQERLLPEQATAEYLADQARGRGGTLAAFLIGAVAGLSPLAAREVAYRAVGAADAPLSGARWEAVAGVLAAILEPDAWEPTVAVRDGSALAYAPYLLQHLAAGGASLERHDSMSAAISAYFARRGTMTADAGGTGDPLVGERRALRQQVEQARATAERRAGALERELHEADAKDALRHAGETILAFQAAIQPSQESLQVEGLSIPLDPLLGAVENAQRYFARYRKARDAAARLPDLIEQARQQVDHLATLAALVELAEEPGVLRALRREVAAASGSRSGSVERVPAKRGRKSVPSAPPVRRVPLADGWEALVGLTAEGNAAATFDLARPDDLWLHARAVPGAHVILRGPGRGEPPAGVLERAARLAAWHSAARLAGLVEVDCTARRHVRRVPHAPPGLVRYAQERTIRVRAEAGLRT